MALGKNIEKLRLAKGLSPLQLSEKTNHLVSVDAIKRLEERDSSSSRFTAELASALDVSVDQLINGIKNAADQDKAVFKATPLHIENDDSDYVLIKRSDIKLSAGVVGFAVDYDYEEKTPLIFTKIWIEKNGYNPNKLLALKIKGESMEPSLYETDTVIVNTEVTNPVDGDVFAINYEGELLVKRMIRDAGIWWLYSDNPDQRKYPRKECVGDACLIIGKIIHKQSEKI
jgi:phage repressor protein C with HTH and peptisase S24 domain